MTQLTVPRLSRYQVGVLSDTALSEIPIFLLPRPHANDSVKQRKQLDKRFEEIKSLLDLGLVSDISDEFREHIADHIKRTGRRFKVFGLSEMGFLMFKDGVPESVN